MIPQRNIQPTLEAVLSGENPNFLTTSTLAATFAAKGFALSDFDQSSEYTGLFDQYRINRLEVWIIPVAAQGTTVFGGSFSAIDLDDASTPSATATVKAKQGSLLSSGGASHYHSWRPHVAIAAYSGAFTSFANMTESWIDSGSPGVQHYGLKFASDSTPVAYTFNLTYKAHVSFRAPGI